MNLKAKLEEVLEPYCATDDACCAAVEAVLQMLPYRVYTAGDREMTMVGRQFSHEGCGYIQDNNFDFDAGLMVSGDFVDDEKAQYAEMICVALNAYAEGLTK